MIIYVKMLKSLEKLQEILRALLPKLLTTMIFLIAMVAALSTSYGVFGSSVDEIQPPKDIYPSAEDNFKPPEEPTKSALELQPKILVYYESGEAYISILDLIIIDPQRKPLESDEPKMKRHFAKVFGIEKIERDRDNLIVIRKGVKARFKVAESINLERDEIVKLIDELEETRIEPETMKDMPKEVADEYFKARDQLKRSLEALILAHQRVDIPLKDFIEAFGGEYVYDAENNISWISWS